MKILYGHNEEKMKEEQQNTTKRFIKFHEVSYMTTLSRSSIRRLEQMGKFPKRINIGDKSRGWDYEEVIAWMASRKNA